MAVKRRKYPSKLLLFGEYGILLGLDALAIPFSDYSGKLQLTNTNEDKHLRGIYAHLKKISQSLPFKVDLDKLNYDIKNGLAFNSNIPLNYGLGSSGALVASIFDNYFQPSSKREKTDLRALKTTLALIESHFHGVSSGIDPLVSLLRASILVRKSGSLMQLEKSIIPNRGKLRFFLLDSELPGKTGDLVTQFMGKMNEDGFSETFRSAYQQYSNGAIKNLLNKKLEAFLLCFKGLSEFQLAHMSELIPANIMNHFKDGIESKQYFLKICGSGGGGFFLGITSDVNAVEQAIDAPLIFL
ncbi:MAG TPA: hypothetical protein DDX98_04670 [Bacteroidales bacterium]|jgi:mevalonate kinase|nr:hypothetical protein [Bacteroidales bacterium]